MESCRKEMETVEVVGFEPANECIRVLGTMYNGLLSGLGALVWYGYTNMHKSFIGVASDNNSQVGFNLAGMYIQYRETIDKENFVVRFEENPGLIVPTRERALVDYMRFEAPVEDDEHLMIGIDDYLRDHDTSKLLEVAEFYGVKRQMEKAIDLSEEFMGEIG